MIEIRVEVNGRAFDEHVSPRLLLSDFLRHQLKLTGTHVGCEHGVCGSCTVLVDEVATRSCLMLAVQSNGRSIRTVESLAAGARLHPLQEEFHKAHALQCGFCTPGILMASIDFLGRHPEPTRDEIREMLSGQLCRCTGYEPIIDAIEQTSTRLRAEQ